MSATTCQRAVSMTCMPVSLKGAAELVGTTCNVVVDEAGAFAIVVEGVVEPIAIAVTEAVSAVVIGIGASARCDGQVLVTEDMLGLFERTARFVKRYENLAEVIETAVKSYAGEVSDRSFPSADQTYAPKD